MVVIAVCQQGTDTDGRVVEEGQGGDHKVAGSSAALMGGVRVMLAYGYSPTTHP